MISETISLLRKKHGLSQEMLAEKIGVSRQTLSKWETGESNPDIIHSSRLAEAFEITLDELVYSGREVLRSATKDGKFMFGPVTVGEKGQIVIPVKARRIFHIEKGDELLVLGDINQGLALVDARFFMEAHNHLKKGGD